MLICVCLIDNTQTHMEIAMIEIRLREIAESKKLNMSQLQMGANVSMGSVRRFWSGKVKMIDVDVLNRLCLFLDVTPSDILKYTPDTDA